PHMRVALDQLGVDFYAMSAHKMLGPTGVGILYCGANSGGLLDPAVLGGGTVKAVRGRPFELLDGPTRFEAGTPDISGLFGLGACLGYLEEVDWGAWGKREAQINELVARRLGATPGVRVYGDVDPGERVSTFAFDVSGVDCDEVASLLEARARIAVRAG